MRQEHMLNIMYLNKAKIPLKIFSNWSEAHEDHRADKRIGLSILFEYNQIQPQVLASRSKRNSRE